jgi:hypothetical protein
LLGEAQKVKMLLVDYGRDETKSLARSDVMWWRGEFLVETNCYVQKEIEKFLTCPLFFCLRQEWISVCTTSFQSRPSDYYRVIEKMFSSTRLYIWTTTPIDTIQPIEVIQIVKREDVSGRVLSWSNFTVLGDSFNCRIEYLVKDSLDDLRHSTAKLVVTSCWSNPI